METDAKTFAEWGIDYVKLDGCYADPSEMDRGIYSLNKIVALIMYFRKSNGNKVITTNLLGYPEFGALLNQTGRPMVYSCSWYDS